MRSEDVRRSMARAVFGTAFAASDPLARAAGADSALFIDRPGLAAAFGFFAIGFATAFSEAAPAARGRAPFRVLVDALRIFAAPAGLLVRRIEDLADLLHEIFRQARLGDERVAAGALGALGNA